MSVVFYVRPACAYSNGCKSLTCTYSGKRPATDKGVHREVESEGSLRQISGLTNRNYIQGISLWMRWHKALKSNSYTERRV